MYQQLWDWDSMFTGTALLEFGSAPYLAGSMKNFFSQVNVSDGTVKGCLTPEGASETIYHAKPVLIQGALIAAQYANDTRQFRPFAKQMLALDAYWEALSRDAATGLYRWHDQLESGSDNLITSQCPSVLGEGPEKGPKSGALCWVASDAYTLASTDIMVWLHREKLALAAFLTAFGDAAQAARVAASASALKRALRSHLWDEEKGYWISFNTSSHAAIEAKTHLLALPVFGGPGLVDARDATRAWAALSAPDMLSPYGVRSASRDDARYAGSGNYVKPYSNWRGPIWVNTNAMLAYGFAAFGMKSEALDIAQRVVTLLAANLRAMPSRAANGTAWSETYSADDGAPLAAPGFVNWNCLAGAVLRSIRAGANPFALSAL
jgi:hypothetical protein